jgi:hypothetical protein
MRRLLLAMYLLLSAVTPTRAETDDYWIGNYAYTIDGASVRSSVWCQQDRRVSIYELTATDTTGRRYWLLYETWEIPYVDVSHSGLVMVDGTDLVWLEHEVGDIARVTVSRPGCWPREEDPLPPTYDLALPRVVR